MIPAQSYDWMIELYNDIQWSIDLHKKFISEHLRSCTDGLIWLGEDLFLVIADWLIGWLIDWHFTVNKVHSCFKL